MPAKEIASNLPDRKVLSIAPGLHTVANLPYVAEITDFVGRRNCRQFADSVGCDDWYEGGGRRVLRVGDRFFGYAGAYGESPFTE